MDSKPEENSGEEMLISTEDFLSAVRRTDEEEKEENSNENIGTFHTLSNEETIRHVINQFDFFYNDVMAKIKGLNCTPVMREFEDMQENLDESLGRFATKNKTQDVRDQLKAIQKMDDDLKSVKEEYNAARLDRMGVQEEMCRELAKSGDSSYFLELCRFENDERNEQAFPERFQLGTSTNRFHIPDGYFVRRNIKLAKEGNKLYHAMTDEEKIRLQELLKNLSDLEPEEDESNDAENFPGAFTFSNEEKQKMDELERELKKFDSDEKKDDESEIVLLECLKDKDANYIKNCLKNVNEKLEKLRLQDEELKTNDTISLESQ